MVLEVEHCWVMCLCMVQMSQKLHVIGLVSKDGKSRIMEYTTPFLCSCAISAAPLFIMSGGSVVFSHIFFQRLIVKIITLFSFRFRRKTLLLFYCAFSLLFLSFSVSDENPSCFSYCFFSLSLFSKNICPFFGRDFSWATRPFSMKFTEPIGH